jgi:hypothetical protein
MRGSDAAAVGAMRRLAAMMTRGFGCLAPAFQSRTLAWIGAGAPAKFFFPKEGGTYIGGDAWTTWQGSGMRWQRPGSRSSLS